jgi:hypothetical protein
MNSMSRKEFLIIAIATLITIICWVVFDVLHKRSAVTISPEVQTVIEPIDPNFDLEAIQ